MKEQIDDFIIYLCSERGLAHNTIEAYHRDILFFTSYLQKQGIGQFVDVTINHILYYLLLMKNQNYAVTSIARALVSIKVLFAFLKTIFCFYHRYHNHFYGLEASE